MTNIIKETIEKIKEKKLLPKPKWQFLLVEISYWFLFGISIVLGAFAVSFILFISKYEIHPVIMQLSGIKEWMIFVPFFWLVLLALFIVASIYYWKKTDKGYKFNVSLIIGSVIIISLVFGFTMFSIKLPDKMDKHFYQLPGYHQLSQKRAAKFIQMHGDDWIGGQVINDLEDNFFNIQSFDDVLIRVNVSHTPQPDLQHIILGEKLRILGELSDLGFFEAEQIHPWTEKINCERNFCPVRITR